MRWTGYRAGTARLIVGTVVALLSLSACTDNADSGPTISTTSGSPMASGPAKPDTTARNALFFYPPVSGATLNYANSGATSGATDVTVRAVTPGAGGQTVTVDEVNSGAGTPVTVERTFRTGSDGSLSIDASAFGASAPGFKVTAAGDDIVLPSIADLEAGKSSTGKTYVEFTGSGVTGRSDVSYVATGAGFESVTVKAGTVNAYVVKLSLDLTSSFAGTVKGTATYWFKPGFGLIRQETVVAGTTMVTELASTSLPLA